MNNQANAVRVLDGLGIKYELREYDVDPDDLSAETVAAKIGLPPELVFKTLAVRGDRNGVCLAVISADQELDFKALAHETGDSAYQSVDRKKVSQMKGITPSDRAKAVVRRNTEEVQSKGNFQVFEELFADDFIDHTPQPSTTPDKTGVRKLYTYLRAAFPDFRAEIHWQLADGDRVTTYKTYHGTHEGTFLGIAPTHRKIHFETVDVMRVQDGKITDHWGVGNLLSLMQQIGGWIPPKENQERERVSTWTP